MAKRASVIKYVLDIDSRLLHNAEKFATTHGQTVKEWLTEAVIAKLEDEIDVAAAEEAMADTEGAISWEDYKKSRKALDSNRKR
ncbi:MAG TPA: DUF6290 family protein [Dehalococcoidales bacterium]|nr:DUF6290 family protein [Dehalococcoidales bacterium]